ncbi:hypothetical protein WJX73_001973 [Symbiochloris irregularis]|uniref:Hemimethylated DNA-binding domain-containing protein n=1 Tax=Symbiochloris irregularis TaxID=706552 RepID=A0AAW1PHS7_9CHLO
MIGSILDLGFQGHCKFRNHCSPDHFVPAFPALSANKQHRSRARPARGKRAQWTCLWSQSEESSSEGPKDSLRARIALEKSDAVYQEVVLLLFQLDLDAQLQRALNMENYTEAQAVRQRREKIDGVLVSLQNAKSAQITGAEEPLESESDLAISCMRLQQELQEAIEKEDYAEATRLRDAVKGVQDRREDAAGRLTRTRDDLNRQRKYKLGQRVLHATLGYRGLICGWDAACVEQEEWQRDADTASLREGEKQPFYHVLVDARDWHKRWEPGLTYVPQERLEAPEEPKTWITEHGDDEFEHAFLLQLFLGCDERGDLLPTRALREKYLQPRMDIQPPPGTEESEG